VFPPRTSPGCGWCDYLRSCPEGRAAAVPRRPWDALAEL
jgi:putative RecB family exonuclease